METILHTPQVAPLAKMVLLNVRSRSNKSFILNDFILTHKFEFYFSLKPGKDMVKSALFLSCVLQNTIFLNSLWLTGCGGGLAMIFNNVFTWKPMSTDEYTSFEWLLCKI